MLKQIAAGLAAIVLPAAAHLRQALDDNAPPAELLKAVQTEIGGILGSLLMKDYQPERFMLLMRELQSLEEKLKVIRKNNLAGVAEWSLGMEESGVWDLILQYVN